MKYLILFSLFLVVSQAVTNLTVVFEWKELEFSWPNETFKNESINSGDYISENNVPFAVAVWRDKVFVAMPRWYYGVAASLAYFPLNSTEKSPVLTPYPSWENHNIKNYSSNTIVSSPRFNVDSCNRLWLVDSGNNNALGLGGPITVGPATILVIDLETDEIIRRYELKSTDVSELTSFAYVAIDIDGDKCDEAYAYITDRGAYSLIVYSYEQNDSWTFKHNFFYLEPLLGNLWFHGVNFQENAGVLGAALGPRQADGYRTLHIHPFISHNQFSVNTRVLQNSSLVSDNNYYYWKHEGYKGAHTCSLISAFDETTNTLIMAQPETDAIGCWNPKVNLEPETFHLVAQDHETIAFPTDLKIDADRNLWTITNKVPVFMFSTLDYTETNFRILSAPVDDLIKGSGCDI